MYHTLLFIPLLYILGGLSCAALSGRAARRLTAAIHLLSAAACALLGAALFVRGETQDGWSGGFAGSGAMPLLFGGLFALVGALCLVWGRGERAPSSRRCQRQNLLQGVLLALLLARDVASLFALCALMSLLCWALMTSDTPLAPRQALRSLAPVLIGVGLMGAGIALLIALTGHLSLSELSPRGAALLQDGRHVFALTLSAILTLFGLGTQGAFCCLTLPLRSDTPDDGARALLSGPAAAGYALVLARLVAEVFSIGAFSRLNVTRLILLGGGALLVCSLRALWEPRGRRTLVYWAMTRLSYLLLGVGLGAPEGLVAGVYQALLLSCTQPLLALSAGKLMLAAGSDRLPEMTGCASRARLAGAGFAVGVLSLLALPPLGGFAGRVLLLQAAHESFGVVRLLTTLFVAAGSVLCALYTLPPLIRFWMRPATADPTAPVKARGDWPAQLTFVCLIALILALGLFFEPVTALLQRALF